MRSKYRVIFHMDYIHCVIHIILPQKLENLQFNSCLVIILLFVFYNFQCNLFFFFMVETLDSYSETTLSQKTQNFISVSNMIFKCYSIISFAVVESKVWVFLIATSAGSCTVLTLLNRDLIHHGLYLFDALSEIVYLWIV